MVAVMNAEQKLAAQAEAAKKRSEKARKKAREAGRVPVNLILSERSRRVLDVLAGQFQTKSAAVDHLCDQVLIPGDPGFVEARDGLVGSRLETVLITPDEAHAETSRVLQRSGFLAASPAETEWLTRANLAIMRGEPMPDNPTKTVAAQGKTGDNAVKKKEPAHIRKALADSIALDTKYNGVGARNPAKRLTPGRANPKQMKVKK